MCHVLCQKGVSDTIVYCIRQSLSCSVLRVASNESVMNTARIDVNWRPAGVGRVPETEGHAALLGLPSQRALQRPRGHRSRCGGQVLERNEPRQVRLARFFWSAQISPALSGLVVLVLSRRHLVAVLVDRLFSIWICSALIWKCYKAEVRRCWKGMRSHDSLQGNGDQLFNNAVV